MKDITPTPHNSPISKNRQIHPAAFQQNNWVDQNPPRPIGVSFANDVMVIRIQKSKKPSKCVIL